MVVANLEKSENGVSFQKTYVIFFFPDVIGHKCYKAEQKREASDIKHPINQT